MNKVQVQTSPNMFLQNSVILHATGELNYENADQSLQSIVGTQTEVRSVVSWDIKFDFMGPRVRKLLEG